MSITLKRRLSAFSTGELQSGVLPRSVDAKITVVSELISPWQLLRGLRTPWGKANGFFLGKFTALPAQSHGGLVKRWFFPFQLGEFQVPAVNFPGCIYVYIYIHILLTVCWHHPRLMTGSCPTVFQYLLIAIDSMRQGIHFQPLEVSTSQLSSCFPTKGKTENGKFFIFTPVPGEMIQFDEHIFQMGWNHQQEDETSFARNHPSRCRSSAHQSPRSRLLRRQKKRGRRKPNVTWLDF